MIELIEGLAKIVVAFAIYAAVLGAGIFVAWWIARRARRQEGKNHE